MICSGMKVLTQRAAEPEVFRVVSYLKIQQYANDLINGYIIA
jgi:hypothetical protein